MSRSRSARIAVALVAARLAVAAPARAQNAAAADAAALNANTLGSAASLAAPRVQAPSLTVPSLVAAPSLNPAFAPTLALAPAPALSPTAAPYAAAVALPAAVPAALPAAAPVASRAATVSGPGLLSPVERLLNEAPVSDQLPDDAAISLTKRMFGEDAGASDATVPEYLRTDAAPAFGASELTSYRDARRRGAGSKDSAARLVEAGAALLASVGVATSIEERRGVPTAVVVPQVDGPPLNRLAWDLKRAHGAALLYQPSRTKEDAVAAFNHRENALFLPHFDHPKFDAAVLHETHHSNYAARQARGDLSPFHAVALAKHGKIVPGALYYSDYASLEELTGHAKTIKHLLAAARGGSERAKLYEIDAEAIKAADVSRSAAILLNRLRLRLADGGAVVPVPDDDPLLAELGPIGGGRWHEVSLPWSRFFVPVLDETPAPRPKGLARLFAQKPESAANRAARRTADAVLAYLNETAPLLTALHAGLNADAPDLDALNALADKLALAGPRAEKRFAASGGPR